MIVIFPSHRLLNQLRVFVTRNRHKCSNGLKDELFGILIVKPSCGLNDRSEIQINLYALVSIP